MKSITKGIAITLLLFVAAALLMTPVAARGPTNKDIQSGDTIFINEKCLNISALGNGTTIQSLVYYTDVSAGTAGKRISNLGDTTCWDVDPAYGLDAYAGQLFYAVDATQTRQGSVVIDKVNLQVDLVLDKSRDDSVNGKSITRDTLMDVKLTNNVADAMNHAASDWPSRDNSLVNVEFTTPDGGKVTTFGGVTGSGLALSARTIYVGPFTLTNERPGQYTVMAKWPGSTATLNASNFYGKSLDSNTGSFTILTKAVAIETNKDTVIRGNDFVVTITGEAKKNYFVFIKKTGEAANAYPYMRSGQSNVNIGVFPTDPNQDPLFVSKAQAETEFNTVPTTYATVNTDASGKRTIEFATNQSTKDKTFTVKVYDPLDASKYDQVDVAVKKGAVTVDAAGTKIYYIGEEVRLFGTNTDSQDVYLFITGPNLPVNGGQIESPHDAVIEPNIGFKDVTVNSDNTWEFKWPTDKIGIDAGTYTIYAVSVPRTKDDLSNATYDTVSVTLQKPFVNASLPATRVAKGDEILVTGTAQGKPSVGVKIWLLGKNYFNTWNPSVNDDLTFSQKIERGTTADLTSGQYFLVVQHPMYNGQFDVDTYVSGSGTITTPGVQYCLVYNVTTSTCEQYASTNATSTPIYCPDGATVCVINKIKAASGAGAASVEFNVVGPGSLMGSDAADALTKALDQSNIDDSYTKAYFLLEEPSLIISPISDKTVGDKFTISGTTNLAVGDKLQVTVTSASFKPTEKTAPTGFSGAAGPSVVTKGTGVDNVWSFDVDTSAFNPDQYIVSVEAIDNILNTKTTTQFFVSAVTPTPVTTPVSNVTVKPTTAVPMTTATTTAAATTTPGFGAVIALIGLGAVAVLVLRRH